VITDKANENLKDKIFKNVSDSVRSVVEHASVLLTGSGFTGSGVILAKDPVKQKFYVLTAKHNLLKAAQKAHSGIVNPGAWQAQAKDANTATLVTYFKTKVQVQYRGVNLEQLDTDKNPTPVNPARAIAEIKMMDDWGYDVCQLEVDYTKATTPRALVLGFGPNEGEKFKGLVKEQSQFLTTLPALLSSKNQVDGIRKYQFLQVGYGVPDRKIAPPDFTGTIDKYKIKATEFTTHATRTVYDSSVGTYTDTFQLNSDENNTTYVGDSGGPLFGVELGATGATVYLLGVTLGSDYFLRQSDEPTTLAEDPDGKYNNAATSLSAYYDKVTGLG
jgi:hypothetical protein